MSKKRPQCFFFRGSITREQKEEFAKIKEKRETFKNNPKYQEISDKRKETIDSRVVYGTLRNFDAGEIDRIAAENRLKLEEYRKEKEKLKAEALAAKVAKAAADKVDMSHIRFNPSSSEATAARVLTAGGHPPTQPSELAKPEVEVEQKSE